MDLQEMMRAHAPVISQSACMLVEMEAIKTLNWERELEGKTLPSLPLRLFCLPDVKQSKRV